MKVLFDHQIFTMQRFGGISRYFVELLKNFSDDVETETAVSCTHNVYLRKYFGFRNLPSVPAKRAVGRALNHLKSVRALKKGDYDVFHPTYYDDYFLRHLKHPFVVTVHDLTHERFPEYFAADDPTVANKKRLILESDAIIAISESTRRDIIEFYGVDPAKVITVHHGSVVLSPTEEPVDGLPENYILFVGDRHGYKNFSRLFEAFCMIARERTDVSLVCTGRPFRKGELEMIAEAGLSDRVRHVYATDAQLRYLYSHALCFTFPSLYEGFGFPILEAYECGCPVALSAASCFPEVAGDAGEYFDPTDAADMARALRRLLDDPERRRELVRLGEERKRLFTWEKTARLTEAVYRRIAQ